MSFTQYKYEKILTDLQKKESPDGSTCLISLYVPPERAIAGFVQELTEEIGTATNIRSKFTQKNVVSALRTVIGKLKLYGNKAPKSGIVFFAGATADSGPKDYKIESYVFEPPEPVSRKLYVCDNRFHVDHLLDRMVEKDLYALLAIDSAKATIAALKGGSVEIIKTTRSGAAKKHRKGGQSSVRFARLREEVVNRFLKRVADELKEIFIESADKELKGIIVGGPGQTKDQVVDYFDPRLKEKLLGVLDLGYGGDKSGIRELETESQDILEGVALIEQKKLVYKFLEALREGKASYGEKEVRENLKLGSVDTLLISRGLDLIRMKSTCLNCSFIQENTIKAETESNFISEVQKTSCPECNTLKWDIEKNDLIIDLGTLAEETGAGVEIINETTEEGRQIQTFSGICAILRYAI